MSNKGAVKKTFDAKNAHRSQTKSKTREISDQKEKDIFRITQNADVNSKLKLERSGINLSSLVKKNSKSNGTIPKAKAILESDTTKTLYKSSRTPLNVSRTIKVKESETLGAKRMKKTESSSKLMEKIKISEKRSRSTIYVLESNTNKPKSLSTKQMLDSKALTTKKYDKTDNSKNKRTTSRERRKSRTLSPSEVKVLHTAIPNQKFDSVVKPDSDEDFDYEDDFDIYNSDFEECTDSNNSLISEEANQSRDSPILEPIEMKVLERKRVVNSYEIRKTEEERMLDSGHYELAEARKRAARLESLVIDSSLTSRKKTPLTELTHPINQTFREEKQSENKSLPLSMDEGFEDARSGDFAKSPPISQISETYKITKPLKKKKETRKILSRGEELMTMIKLDIVEWSLYESAPIAYDEFIRNYGKLNTQQMCTQTNDDNLEEETQTEKIESRSKWTQFPITCRKNLNTSEDIISFRKEQIGVGGNEDDLDLTVIPSYDVLQLNEFLERAGKVILCLLEERRFGGNILQKNNHDMPFSAGCIKLSINSLTFLTGRSVTAIIYSETLNKILLTIHAPKDEDIETSNKQDYVTDCCIGCIWNISEPSRPTKIIYSQSPITSCCFHPTSYNIIFAGLQDGSINIWNLKEDEMWHKKVSDKENKIDWVIRSSTYTTTGNFEIDGHKSEIVALRILSKVEKEALDTASNKFLPIQICSLDENGSLIVWSILSTMIKNSGDYGVSHWGDIKLTKCQEVPLSFKKTDMENHLRKFFDLTVDSINNNDVFIATNSNSILHANSVGGKTNPMSYKEDEMEWSGNTTCIERCPFKQSFFLVGCDDGTLRLHSLNVKKSLLQLRNENYKSAVKIIQWSKSKPFTLFVLDINSQIHVWDLSSSDTSPAYSISTKSWNNVECIQLSPCNSSHDLANQYLAIGTDMGNVEVHKLSKEFYNSQQDFLEDINNFLRYVPFF